MKGCPSDFPALFVRKCAPEEAWLEFITLFSATNENTLVSLIVEMTDRARLTCQFLVPVGEILP